MKKDKTAGQSPEQAKHERQNRKEGRDSFAGSVPDKKLSGPNRPAE
ncbi:hypothetical protein J31TS4_43360 [Paenibacillus sp. J31TS4]|nr:hypothetical protein [Paenibacillus sp. J31TS4]GIP41056.1 hypothetical protein J31TS4_43360 [Paenibacillus sp. J31TS4]